MNGRNLPAAQSGHTFSLNAAMIAAFCSTVRERKVDPVTVRCLRWIRPKSVSALPAAHQRDKTKSAFMRQQIELARDVVAADHIKDRIDTAAVGEFLADADEFLRAVVDRNIGAIVAAGPALLVGAGGGQYLGAECLSELDGSDADAA